MDKPTEYRIDAILQNQNHANTPHLIIHPIINNTIIILIQSIIDERVRKKEDQWGAKAILQLFLCQRHTP